MKDFSKQTADDTKGRLALKVSASIGRKVLPPNITRVDGEHGNRVTLDDGSVWRLFGGNAAYKAGTGQWYVNGNPAPAPAKLKAFHDGQEK